MGKRKKGGKGRERARGRKEKGKDGKKRGEGKREREGDTRHTNPSLLPVPLLRKLCTMISLTGSILFSTQIRVSEKTMTMTGCVR